MKMICQGLCQRELLIFKSQSQSLKAGKHPSLWHCGTETPHKDIPFSEISRVRLCENKTAAMLVSLT